MIDSLYVVGGQAKKDAYQKGGEHRYRNGLIVQLDCASGATKVCAEYITPPDACPADLDPTILFKAGSLRGQTFYVCTQTEVLLYALPAFEISHRISIPHFNDVHHVLPTSDETVLVANTGLDMVLEVDLNGSVTREWSVLEEDPWTRFSRDVDYRQVLSTKPHKAHPNYVFEWRGDIWVTRFEQRDAICLTQSDRRIAIGIEAPHDGVSFEDLVYFTTVDGHVVVGNVETRKVERVIDLNKVSPERGALGWCRGIAVLDRRHVVVGFSRLRPTTWRKNVSWLKRSMGVKGHMGDAPTRVALYDLDGPALCWERDLEVSNLGAIFSIHRTNHSAAND